MSCCHSSFELLLLLGTWPSACYQRVDVLSQLLDIHSAFELLLGTWPCACYQRVDVLSQLFDSSLHVGFRNYQSSPTRRARTENKKVNDHFRSSVNTREVSEGSMGGVSHCYIGAGFTGIIDGALQNSEDLYINKRPYTGLNDNRKM